MSMNNDRSSCIYTESSSNQKIKLILSKEIQNQVNYLHNQVGQDEWSGILLYKVIEGNISEPGSLVLKADYIYPMDIGSSTYTEFDYDEHYVDMHEKLPIIQDGKRVYKIGTIHTHHNMSTFFSGTDTGELHNNAPKHNFYLSLIFNFAVKPIAKVAVFSDEGEAVYKFRGQNVEDKYEKRTQLKGFILTYDCDIEFEEFDWFIEKIKELKAKRIPKTVYTYPSYNKIDNWESIVYPEKKSKKKDKEGTQLDLFSPMHQLCCAITGNFKEFSDIYNVLKRVQNDYDSAIDKQIYLFNFQDRVSNNFKILCANYKGRTCGKYELDEFAERTLAAFKGYKFDFKFNSIANAIELALEKFIIYAPTSD